MIKKLLKGDNCSAVPEFNLSNCCRQHDIDYENCGKFKADWSFVKCGYRKALCYKKWYQRLGTRSIATIYFIGVTIFGWIPFINAKLNRKV